MITLFAGDVTVDIRGQEEVVNPNGYVLKDKEISFTLHFLGINLIAPE